MQMMLNLMMIFSIVGSMAPPAKVSVGDAVKTVKQFMLHFITDQFPNYTSKVWELMSKEVKGEWSAHNFYINVRENRRQILTLAQQELGIVPPADQDQPKTSIASDSNSEMSDNENISDNEESKMEHFMLILNQEEWSKIRPSEQGVGKLLLTPWVWTNVVSLAFWRQYKLPCAFVYKRADITAVMWPKSKQGVHPEKESNDLTVTGTPDVPGKQLPITHQVSIQGKCRSKECGNSLSATAEFRPDDQSVIFHIRTQDTRNKEHEEIKRPFNGERRKKAYKELIAEGAAVWRKRQAREHMVEGDLTPPFLPSEKVLRVAKKEAIDLQLQVKTSDGRDLIKTIEQMSEKSEFRGLIHAVSSIPFYVFYMTQAQLQAYKEYSRLNKIDCTICIDATGSLVQKMNRPSGAKSGHIFLYVIVINFEHSTLPVYQMLSEVHETEHIEFWLKKWIRLGAPRPKHAVCDYSRALISALCLAFNNVTIKSYVNACFMKLANSNDHLVDHLATLIRIDVSHLIHLVCRWKCFKTVTHSQIKEFYIRCVALMVDCRSLSEFQNLFTLTCTIGLQEYEDVEIDDKSAKGPRTANDVRKSLENFISDYQIKIEPEPPSAHHKVRTEMDDTKDFLDYTTSGETITQWIDGLLMKAKGCENKGTDLNPFYLPEFVVSLSKLAKEFPLWTAVMVPHKAQHATSSSVEGYFGFLKNNICNHFRLPIRADKFLTLQVRDILGENLLSSSKLARCLTRNLSTENSQNQIDSTDALIRSVLPTKLRLDDSDLKSHENWRAMASERNFGDAHVWNDEGSFTYPGTHNISDVQVALDHSYCKIGQSNTLMDQDISLHHFIDSDTTKNDKPYSLLSSLNISEIKEPIVQSGEEFQNTQVNEIEVSGCSISNTQELIVQSGEGFPHIQDNEIEVTSHSVSNTEEQIVQHDEGFHDEVEKKTGTKRSQYFRAFPEGRQLNANLTRKSKKGVLLPNGLVCSRPIKINGKIVFLKKTCPFDSLVHILLTSSIDDLHYASIVKNSDNPTMQLVSKLATSGTITKETLDIEQEILSCSYTMKCEMQTANRILSYSLDAEDSIANVVRKVLESEPSVISRKECSRCGVTERSIFCMAPNHKLIIEKGFCALEKALAFRYTTYKLRCGSRNCGGQYTLYNNTNSHILIELDIRGDHTWISGLPGSLRQLPIKLKIGGQDELRKEYRLTGLVGYKSDHFIAYCRRSSGVWQEYNDVLADISSCSSDKVIVPHLAVYICNDQQFYSENKMIKNEAVQS